MVVLVMLNVGAGPFQPLNYDGGMEDRRPRKPIIQTEVFGDRVECSHSAQFSSQSSGAVFQTYLKIISKVISNISSRSYLRVLLCEAVKKNVKKMF